MEHELKLNMRLFLLSYLFLLCFVMIVTFGIDRRFDVNKGILYIGLRIGLARITYIFYLKMFYNSCVCCKRLWLRITLNLFALQFL